MQEFVNFAGLFGLETLFRLGTGKGEVLANIIKDFGEVKV
jgi:hypothetical protein